jgi:hypothetical protein
MEQYTDDSSATEIEISNGPDFGWPYRVTESIFEKLSEFWNDIEDAVSANAIANRIAAGIGVIITLYLLLIWLSICYIEFPVSPFGFWDFAKWLLVAGSLIWGTVGFALGLTVLAGILFLCAYVFVLFALSLCFLSWAIWQGFREHSDWIKRYYIVTIAGFIAALVLVAFVEGSDRYWSDPLDPEKWGRLALIIISAWSALYCHLVRNKLHDPKTPGRIIQWTVALVVVLGALEYWQANRTRDEYFLNKDVRENPNDSAAWLSLAWHNALNGYQLESDPGDGEHTPPNPAPSFAEALNCYNRAIELGTRDFNAYFARAEMADKLGKKEESITYGKEALQNTWSDSLSSERVDEVKWLNEMIARNAAEPTPKESYEQKVRAERIQNVPTIVRWVFSYL